MATLQPVMAQEAVLEQQLRVVTEQNILATQSEDRQAVAATMHPDSPGYRNSLDLVTQMGQAYDLEYRLVDFRLVALDGEYAYARVSQETRKVQGPQFVDNLLTALWVYRQHEGSWKVWTLAVLEADLL